MTSEDFIAGLIESAINDNVRTYQSILDRADTSAATDPYWKRVLPFFGSLKPEERELLVRIMRQACVDAVSNTLGIIDGSSQLAGRFHDFDLFDQESGRRLNGDLQDLFLEAESA